jgi:hypothetical protein
VLRDDITDSSPGNSGTLYIDGANGPSVDGLPSSGTLVVGDEKIAYASKTTGGVVLAASGARGADSTTAAAHSAGDAVFLSLTQGGKAMVTDALPIKSIGWERYGGTIYPANFVWRWSGLPARTPNATLHENDYEADTTVTGHSASTHSYSLTAGTRVRSLLLELQKMTTDPARGRMNRIKALVDESYFSAANWLSGGETVEELIEQVALNAGMPSGALVVTATGQTPTGFITALDYAWAVMVSAAEMGGSAIRVERDSKITVAPDTFWGTAVSGYTPVETWNHTDAASVELVRTGGGMVSQVRIPWQTPDGVTKGTAKYPDTPGDLGVPQTLNTMYFADEATAVLAARKRYFMGRYPYELVIALAAGDLSVEPRQVHRIEWQLDDTMQPLDRMMLVTQVEHTIANNMLNTVIVGLQIDRESDN